MTSFPRFPVALAAIVLSGCTSPANPTDPFEATGETIAFSGGAAGPAGACSTCHGTRGQGDGNLAPRLAGLDQGYALRQLEHFASGARRNPQMYRIARRLDARAREKVTAYYAALPRGAGAGAATANGASAGRVQDCRAATLYHVGDPARGVASCASCHGADGQGNAGNPPLAGQPAPYLARQLDDWATGKRYGDADGAMTTISRALSAADRQAVAAYAAGLAGGGDGRSAPAACPRTRRPDRPDGA